MWNSKKDPEDVVSFEYVEYICNEDVGDINLTIKRSGLAHAEESVEWHTINRNIHDNSYLMQDGLIVFTAGQRKAEITITILPNHEWTTESLMYVQLKNPTSCLALGLELTTIVILNQDKFPSGIDPNARKVMRKKEMDGYEETGKDTSGVIDDGEDYYSEIRIVYAFFMHNVVLLTNETKWGILYKMWPAFAWLLETFLIYFAILSGDTWLGEGPVALSHHSVDDDEKETDDGDILGIPSKNVLIYMGVIWVLNQLFRHYVDDKYHQLRLGGKASMKLRTAIMDTTIQLNNASIEEFTTGRVTKIMEESVKEAIFSGWVSVFHLIQDIFMIVINLAWVVFLSIEGRSYILLFPALIAFVDYIIYECQNTKLTNLAKQGLLAGELWCDFFTEATDLRRLITDYRMGLDQAMTFSTQHAQYNKDDFRANELKRRTLYAATYMPAIIIGFIFGCSSTRWFSEDSATSLALFVTLVSVVKEYGNSLNSIFRHFCTFSDAAASIKLVAALLNSETRRKDLIKASIRRKKMVAQAIEDGIMVEDEERIVVHNLGYSYSSTKTRFRKSTIKQLFLCLEPGKIIGLDATNAGTGNRTLMKLLARQLLPQEGFIYYPNEWRVRFIDAPPLLYSGTLRDNLLFGCRVSFEEEELLELCEMLKMSEYLLKDMRDINSRGRNVNLGKMGEKVGMTDRIMITIARAMLSNVDLLLIHGSLDAIDQGYLNNTMKIFEDMIKHNCVQVLKTEMMKTPEHLKKAKTVIISSKSRNVLEYCNMTQSMLVEHEERFQFLCADYEDEEYDNSNGYLETIAMPTSSIEATEISVETN